MDLDDLVAVSGMPGLYKMAANRSNGLIIEDLDTGKRKFASSRRHQFTPLGSIAIYTDDGDSTELKNVFRNMQQQLEDNPPVAFNAPPEEIKEYFEDVLPNYDPDRVYISDMKKVLKWFAYLQEHNLLEEEEDENKDQEETEEESAISEEE